MQYSIAKDIFGTPWHLSASGFQQYFPVVIGMINGADIAEEDEPKENIPYALSANTGQLVSWSTEETEDPDEEESKEKVVHVLPVRGVLMKHDMVCGPRGARTLGNRLLQADADPSVIGHVMIIEGPGGLSMAVPELSEAIQKCEKPVVAWVDGLMASAHMYVGSYAKEIIASRETDQVGCIGTMLTYSGRKSKSDEDLFKVREVTIYADQAFEKNEEYEKAINDFDFTLARERLLNPHNEQFINDIKANRPNVEDTHLHGRTFSAKEVVGTLIDSIGSFDDAVNRVIELAQFKKEETNAGSNGSQANSNNQNQKQIMSKTYLNIQTALGSQDALEFEADGSRTFSQEEMESVETALADNSSTELQGQLDTANTNLQTANNTIATRDQTILDLQSQIAELKGNPAETTPPASTQTDGGTEKPGPVAKGNNIVADIESVSKEYLSE